MVASDMVEGSLLYVVYVCLYVVYVYCLSSMSRVVWLCV